MNLFDYMRENTMEKEAPLASRLRPRTLDEVVGQQHIIGKDKLLYRAIKADKLGSLIFYGPPGTGKTTLAKVIANTTALNLSRSTPQWPEKGYGGDCGRRKGQQGNVRQKNHFVCRRDPPL